MLQRVGTGNKLDWFIFVVSQTHHYVPQASNVFRLADGFNHMTQIPEIDALLVKHLF